MDRVMVFTGKFRRLPLSDQRQVVRQATTNLDEAAYWAERKGDGRAAFYRRTAKRIHRKAAALGIEA